jgi:hypothetical protein
MSNGTALKPWSVSTPVPSASLTSLLFVVVIVGCVYAGREKLAQIDADRGLLDNDRMTQVRDAVIEIVDDLSTHQDKVDLTETVVDDAEDKGPLAHIALAENSLARDDEEIPRNWRTGRLVLCVPGFGIFDEAFTAIVAQAIEKQGIAVRAESRDALSVARIFALDTNDIELVCVCYLATVTPAQIRYSIRRLRRKVPDKFILVTMAGAVDVDEMASRTSSNGLADSVNTRPTTVSVSVLIDFKAHDVSESIRRAPCAVPRNDGGITEICTVRIAALSASTEAMTSSASACG